MFPGLIFRATSFEDGPDLTGRAPQDVLQLGIHPACRAAGVRLGKSRLGDQAVLANQVHRHVPLTAVADRVGEQEVDGAVVDGAVSRLDDGLEQVVGPLELVPEVNVGLAELEVLEIHLLHRTDPEQVQSREQPAPTTLHLSGHLPIIQLGAERGVHVLNQVPVQSQIGQLHVRHGVLRDLVRWVRRETLPQFYNLFSGNRLAHWLTSGEPLRVMATLSHCENHSGAGSAKPAAMRVSAIGAAHDSTSPAVSTISEPSSVIMGSERSFRMRMRRSPLSSSAGGSSRGAGGAAPVARPGNASICRIRSSSSISGSSQLPLGGVRTASGVS